ncbi:MAG TPA: hypothetical protein VHW90_00995 [Stellaceae bacterium]|jgi:hypothetical protein|nr:hypothetical protein [Stellaceae bacterium]
MMRFWTRFGWYAAAAIVMAMAAGPVASARRHPAPLVNPVNERLIHLSPAERAATLARTIGHWCVGIDTFLMGVVGKGPGEGNAYWSIRCTDGTSWAVQINPTADIVAIDCETFKESAPGKECFKKF